MDATEGSIVVNATVAHTYARCLAFEDYPKFITVLKSVQKLNKNHFSALLEANGKQREAVIEIVLRVPGRRLAWRTLADHRPPDHLAAGVVSFSPLSDQRTRVTLKLTSRFGRAVSDRVGTYLQNFKRLIENESVTDNPL